MRDSGPPPELIPDTGDVAEIVCCAGASIMGPAQCTCWVPVFDLEQAPAADFGDEPHSKARRELCHDCAYRRGSPEMQDREKREEVLGLLDAGEPFFCHQGMRRVVAWRHPDGREIVPPGDHYAPPIVGGDVPLKADGTPAELCAGWRQGVARRYARGG